MALFHLTRQHADDRAYRGSGLLGTPGALSMSDDHHREAREHLVRIQARIAEDAVSKQRLDCRRSLPTLALVSWAKEH